MQNINSYRFLELLKPNYNDALRYTSALCSRSSKDDAKDLLQQSLLQALEKFSSLNDEDKFRGWFFRIITNVYYSSVRSGFWKKFLSLEKKNEEALPLDIDLHRKNEETDILMKALDLISEKEKSAILLYEIAGFSVREIADMQEEKSESAVKSRLSRARSKLREFILKLESGLTDTKKIKRDNFTNIEDETDNIISKAKEK